MPTQGEYRCHDGHIAGTGALADRQFGDALVVRSDDTGGDLLSDGPLQNWLYGEKST